MRVFKLTLAYDGTNFAGWQSQPQARTVQDTLEAAWAQVTGESQRCMACSRTDAGVHARGQVASFHSETQLTTDALLRALNSQLPHDVVVREVVEAPAHFQVLRDARRKWYRYVIHNGRLRDVFNRHYAWHYYQAPLDAERMHRAAQLWLGYHDFAGFQTSGSPRLSTCRTVFRAAVERGRGEASDLVVFDVEADGFLYNMVRAMMGTLVEVGRGRRPESWIREILASRNRQQAGMTAPPQGLCLMRVWYGDDLPESPGGSAADSTPAE